MFKKTRALSATVGVLCALLAMGATALAATGKSKGKADSGTQHVAITHDANGFSYSAGDGTDKLFGATAVTYKLKLLPSQAPGTLNVTAKPVVLYTKKGALAGTGSGTLTIGQGGSAPVANGKLTLTKGT